MINKFFKSRRGNKKKCNIMYGKEDASVHRLKEYINYMPVLLKTQTNGRRNKKLE